MLKFERLCSEYFDEYNSWFENESIKKALYSIDQEWLEFVLNDETGVEYAVFLDGELIAVLGVEFPTDEDPYFAIKNLAINPSKFRRGLGSQVLTELIKLHVLKEEESWVAFVELNNLVAQKFFEKNNWKRVEDSDEGDAMIRYEIN